MQRAAPLSDRTRTAYAADLRHWQAWCRRRGIPPLPIAPDLVRAYVEDLTATSAADGTPRYRASTITRRLAALSWHSRAAGGPDDLARHETVAPALAAARQDPRRAARRTPALTDRDLVALIGAMSHHTWPDGVAAARDTLAFLLGRHAGLTAAHVVSLTSADAAVIGAPRSPDSPIGAPMLCLWCAAARWNAQVAGPDRAERMRALLRTGRPQTWMHVCAGPPFASPPPASPDRPVPLLRRVDIAGTIADQGLTAGSLNRRFRHRLDAAGIHSRDYTFGSLRVIGCARGSR